MQPVFRLLILAASLLFFRSVLAHHAFAIFDFATEIPFDGTVETLKFRNPHIEMTLKTLDPRGNEEIIEFISGPPATMLLNNGLKPEMIAPGTHIIAVGSPLLSDPRKFFLRAIRLDNGEEF